VKKLHLDDNEPTGSRMNGVDLTLVGPAGEMAAELLSFGTWLRDDELLRDRYELVRAPVGPGEMGGTVSHLLLELGDPRTVTAFVVGFWQWQRHRRTSVRAKVSGKDGRSVEIDLAGLNREQVDAVLPSLTESIRQVSREG
jgi:hypothetical protein